MALHLGNNENLKLRINNILYNIQFFSEVAILNGIQLLASDGALLKDMNGLYLTVKEAE